MWYHADLQFDYKRFESEAKLLANQTNNGDISTLHAKVEEIFQKEEFRHLFSKYGFGRVPEFIPSKEEVNRSTDINSILGQWFCWILVKYLIPSPISIGYNWRYISDALPLLGWSDNDVNLLINGMPVGFLLEKQVIPQKVIGKNDPYWYWIRPLYSYNQGGYLPEKNCKTLLSLLKETQQVFIETNFTFPPNIPKDQEQNWGQSFTQGLQDAVVWIETAMNKNLGTYSAIYWEWDEEGLNHS